jgi:hypothetical protein
MNDLFIIDKNIQFLDEQDSWKLRKSFYIFGQTDKNV